MRHPRGTPRVQRSTPLPLDGVPGHHPSERQTSVVVEAIVNPSVEPRHRLLFGDSGELRAVLWEIMSEYSVERARESVAALAGAAFGPGTNSAWATGPNVVY